MPTLLFFADNARTGCGATVRLDSGEACLLSIALTSVRVKKARFGMFGQLLYKETASYRAALTAQELVYLFPDSLCFPRAFQTTRCSASSRTQSCTVRPAPKSAQRSRAQAT